MPYGRPRNQAASSGSGTDASFKQPVGPDRVGESIRRNALARERLELFQGLHRLQRAVVDVRGVEARPFLERELRNRPQEFSDLLLHRYEEPYVVRVPADVGPRLEGHALIGVGTQ